MFIKIFNKSAGIPEQRQLGIDYVLHLNFSESLSKIG